ncbi:hypothetical protein Scep_009980 [Stephania cephalantha]|uniref:Uncharacterized protein n=1 Tax=Stephania cephalantha TaxID=152367 RepID=A0AAP0JUZ9_9MAGN
MSKAYWTLFTVISKLSEDLLHKSIWLSMASNQRIGKGGGTTYSPLKAGTAKMEAARTMANEVVEFLTGRGLATSTTTTTTAATNTTTTSPIAPTRDSQHDSASTPSNPSASQPPKTK